MLGKLLHHSPSVQDTVSWSFPLFVSVPTVLCYQLADYHDLENSRRGRNLLKDLGSDHMC